MGASRAEHTATLLPSGAVLIAGGRHLFPGSLGDDRAELFDPGARRWLPAAGPLFIDVVGHTSTLLPDGQVLTVGGFSPVVLNGGNAYSRLFETTTREWSPGPALTCGRSFQSAILLKDDTVLLASGIDESGGPVVNAERSLPGLEAWVPAGSMRFERVAPGVLLNDGRALFAGGSRGNDSFADSEIYDPATNIWTATAPLAENRGAAVVLILKSGKVLVAGGISALETAAPGAELFDPFSETWSNTGPLALPFHYASQGVVLGDGRVLVTGGLDPAQSRRSVADAEIYDPAQDEWTAIAPMRWSRVGHTLTLLANGQVLVAGGYGPEYVARAEVEIYSPSCRTSQDCVDGWCVDGYCCDSACDGPCQACSNAKTGAANGTCTDAPAGTDPDDECAASSPSTCKTTGACNGRGACEIFQRGVECRAAACEGDLLHPASLCDGEGHCVARQSVSCLPNHCVAGDCQQSCKRSSDCVQGAFCDAGSCVAVRPLGAPCSAAEQCSSGHCFDGVCCDSDCSAGQCQACSAARGSSRDGACEALHGTPCDDGDACTEGDSCDRGECASGSPLECPAAGECEQSSECDAELGCVVEAKPDGEACDDGNACTSRDTCQRGTCEPGEARACPAADDCHQDGLCDPASGECLGIEKPRGAACDDADPCTDADACEDGSCSGVARVCAPSDSCHLAGICRDGECSMVAAPDGTPCESGTCEAGLCRPTTSGSGGSGGSVSPHGGGGGASEGGTGPQNEESSGCSCQLPHRRGSGRAASLAGLLALLFVVRRRARLGPGRAQVARGGRWVSFVTMLVLTLGCSDPESRESVSSSAQPLGWSHIARLGLDGEERLRFGNSVSISGTTLVAGVPFLSGGGVETTNAGAAFVYTKVQDRWTEQQQLRAPTLVYLDEFGSGVAVDGDRLLVGAKGYAGNRGGAFFFARSGASWTLETAVATPGTVPFARSVALEGSRAVLSAPGDEAAYVHVHGSGGWTLQQKLGPADDPPTTFGDAVALNGNTLLVGASTTDVPLQSPSGRVYVFVLSGSTWTQQAVLLSPEPEDRDGFGAALALAGNTAVVGAPSVNVDAVGKAFVYQRNGTTWSFRGKLSSSGSKLQDQFGVSVAIDANRIVVGAPQAGPGAGYSGEAYLFDLAQNEIRETRRFYPYRYENIGDFGYAVAIRGSILAIGAPWFGSRVNVYEYTGQLGEACTSDQDCGSRHCADSVCCTSECGPCGACTKARGSDRDGVCRVLPRSRVCRAPAGACDVAETCDGVTLACPADEVLASGSECRAARGACDEPELCDGDSAACPGDRVKAPGAVCREASEACDQEELCDGASWDCPDDSLKPAGSSCRAAAGECDVEEACDGLSASCPADAVLASGVVCRDSAGPCDLPEICSGWSGTCPADALVARGRVCRIARGACDAEEVCGGVEAECPADEKLGPSEVCRAAAGACDEPESCDGSADVCPEDRFLSSGTLCRAAVSACDVDEKCSGDAAECPSDAVAPAGTTCRQSKGSCDPGELCDGLLSTCPANVLAPDGNSCPSGSCHGGDCVPRGGGASSAGGGGVNGGGPSGGGAPSSGASSGSVGIGGQAAPASADAGADSGCSCRIAERSSSASPIASLMTLATSLLLRRRRLERRRIQ